MLVDILNYVAITYPRSFIKLQYTLQIKIFLNKKSITPTQRQVKAEAIKSVLAVPFLTPANHLNKAHRSEQHGPGAPAFVFSLADYDNFNPGKVSL